MPIHTQCDHCGFGYISKDEMAGKRVRCRNCGQVFAIPHDGNALGGTEGDAVLTDLDEQVIEPGGEDGELPESSLTTTRQLPAITTIESNMTGGVGSAKSRMDRPEDPGLFDVAVAPGSLVRPSMPFVFPYANLLDAWVPRLVPLLVLFWLFSSLWGWSPTPLEQSESRPAWSGLISIGLFVVALCIFWLPMFAGAMKKLARTKNFALPHRRFIRAFCLASLPFALGGVFWLAGDSLITMGIGLFLGLAIAVPTSWFLYRLMETEIASAAISLALATVISTVLSVGLIWGGNFVLNKALNETGHASLFAASPIGPNLGWEVPQPEPPPAPAPKVPRVVPPVAPVVPPTNGIPTDTTVQVPAQPPITQTPPVYTQPPTQVTPPSQTPVPPTVTPAATDLLADHPVLFQGQYLAVDPGVIKAIYPLMPSNFLALVIPSADVDTQDVQQYSIEPFKPLRRDPFASSVARSGYALSTDGQLLARVTRFGDGSTIQVWSFAEGGVTATCPVGATGEEPRLVGFLDENTLLCEWRNVAGAALELSTWNVSTRQFTAYANSREPHSSVIAVMPEGKSIAAVGASLDGSLSLRLLQARNRLTKVALMQSRNSAFLSPSGIGPRDDGSQVAIAYESGGQLELFVANVDEKKGPVKQYVFPSGVGLRALPQGGSDPGNRLTWLPGTDILVYRQLTIDATTGKLVGSMREGPVVDQKLVNDSTMHFVINDGGRLRLLQAKVDPSKVKPWATTAPTAATKPVAGR